MVAHLLAPRLVVVRVVCARCSMPRQGGAREPDAEPAGGDVGLGAQPPPPHKDRLPNRSTSACRHGKGGGTRQDWGWTHTPLPSGTGGAATWGWARRPTAWGSPGGGGPGRAVCFPALAPAGANCTGRGATARVDEGAQRAPHPNGLSVVGRGRGRGRGRGMDRRK